MPAGAHGPAAAGAVARAGEGRYTGCVLRAGRTGALFSGGARVSGGELDAGGQGMAMGAGCAGHPPHLCAVHPAGVRRHGGRAHGLRRLRSRSHLRISRRWGRRPGAGWDRWRQAGPRSGVRRVRLRGPRAAAAGAHRGHGPGHCAGRMRAACPQPDHGRSPTRPQPPDIAGTARSRLSAGVRPGAACDQAGDADRRALPRGVLSPPCSRLRTASRSVPVRT